MAAAVGRSVRQSNVLRGKAWAVLFEAVDPTGANDHFFHMKPTGDAVEITKIELYSTVAGFVEVHRATGTSSSPTALIPKNPGQPQPSPGAGVGGYQPAPHPLYF